MYGNNRSGGDPFGDWGVDMLVSVEVDEGEGESRSPGELGLGGGEPCLGGEFAGDMTAGESDLAGAYKLGSSRSLSSRDGSSMEVKSVVLCLPGRRVGGKELKRP